MTLGGEQNPRTRSVQSLLQPQPVAQAPAIHSFALVENNILVARPAPHDFFPKENETLTPLSLFQKHPIGPRKTSDGKLVEHTLLGDPEDFMEFSATTQPPVSHEPASTLNPIKKNYHSQSNTSKLSARLSASARASSPPARLLELNRPSKQDKERDQWIMKLDVFEKYRELRQEHALKNWERHSVEWNRVESVLSQKTNQQPKDLLMKRLGEFRQKLEERQILQETLHVMESSHVNFWKSGIRVGNELLGLTSTKPTGGPRVMERLLYRENLLKDVNDSPVRSYKEVEEMKQELRHVLEALDPFHDREVTDYFDVEGLGLKPDGFPGSESLINARMKSRMKTTNTAGGLEKMSCDGRDIDDKTDIGKTELKAGSSLLLPVRRLAFDAEICHNAHSVVTLYNNGCTNVHFELIPKNATTRIAKPDGTQRFFTQFTKGIIPPGSAFDIPVSFKSNRPGLYNETWVIHTEPSHSIAGETNPLEITLRGLAIEPFVDVGDRKEIEQLLLKRQSRTFAARAMKEIMDRLDRHIIGIVPPPATLSGSSLDEANFHRNNKQWSLTYVPTVWSQVKALAVEAMAHRGDGDEGYQWNGSLSYLYKVIEGNPDFVAKSNHLQRLNSLISLLSNITRPSISSRLYFMGYDAVLDLAEKVVSIAETTKVRLKLAAEIPEEEREAAELALAQVATGQIDPTKTIAKKGAATTTATPVPTTTVATQGVKPPAATAAVPDKGKGGKGPEKAGQIPVTQPQTNTNAKNMPPPPQDKDKKRPSVGAIPVNKEAAHAAAIAAGLLTGEERAVAEKRYKVILFTTLREAVCNGLDRMYDIFHELAAKEREEASNRIKAVDSPPFPQTHDSDKL